MLLVLQHKDGRWCEPSVQAEAFPEDTADRWADAVCETLGLPAGSLVARVVADDADPRIGTLIADPNVTLEAELLPLLPSRDDHLADLFAVMGNDPGLSKETKNAIASAVEVLRG